MSSNYVRLSSNTVLVAGSAGNATAGNQAIEIQKLTNIDNEGQATNASLMSIDSKTPALGQQLAASSQPVVLTALQLSTLTPLSTITANAGTGVFQTNITNASLAVTGAFFQAVQPVSISGTVPVSGTVTANIGTTNGLALDTSVNSLLKPTSTLAAITTLGSITSTVNVAGAFFQATQPVSLVSTTISNFPATQVVSGTVTANIGTTNGLALDTSVNSLLKPASTLAAVTTLGSITSTVNVAVTNFPATQAISGTVTANAGTNLNTSLLALDSTVAKDASLTSGNQKTQIVNGLNTLAINANGSIFVSGISAVGAAPVLNPIPISGVDAGGLKRSFLTDVAGRLEIDTVVSLPLPAGAATSAAQTTANTSLASLDSKTPVLGQQLAAASQPVVLTAAQLTTLTPLSTITANAGTGTFQTNITNATLPVTGTFFQATQPVSLTSTTVTNTVAVSGTVTANIGTTNGLALDTSVNSLLKPASTLAAVTAITNTVTVKADTLANQPNALKVDGSLVTQPISAASLPLPTGASTSAIQTTMQASLSSLDSKSPVLGQALATASVPVVLTAAQITALTTTNQPTSITSKVLNVAVTGTFTASDAVVAAPIGDGTLVSGASTAGSIVSIVVPAGYQSWTLLLKGYVSGTIYTEASDNSTNGTDGDWIDIKGRRTGTAPGIEAVTYAQVANGYYRGNPSGFTYFRCRLIGATGPSVTVTLADSTGAVFLNSGIPSGNSIIGKVSIDQTTPGTTNLVQVSNFPASQAVSGTVTANAGTGTFQTNITNASLAVTGAFFQATQPVSLTSTTVTNTVAVSGTVTANIGTTNGLALDTSVNTLLKPASTLAAVTTVTTVSAVTAITNALPVGSNTIGAVATVDGLKATYSATIFNLAPATLATDVFTITGSATKTIRITRITTSGTQTTGGSINVIILKRSTANTAGTFTAQIAVPHSSTSAAATATVLAYTANPTLGTLVGNVRSRKVFMNATTGASDEYISEFGTRNSQAIVLRGINEVVAVNVNATTLAGESLDVSIEWTEE